MFTDRTTRQTVPMYRVCWASIVTGARGRSRPLPREVAEFVAHDEALGTTMRRIWIEPEPGHGLPLSEADATAESVYRA